MSKIKPTQSSHHIPHWKNLTLFLITRMACYVTTVGNLAAKMLNEISQEEDYLWDFLSLLRLLLKYQRTVISSKIL